MTHHAKTFTTAPAAGWPPSSSSSSFSVRSNASLRSKKSPCLALSLFDAPPSLRMTFEAPRMAVTPPLGKSRAAATPIIQRYMLRRIVDGCVDGCVR